MKRFNALVLDELRMDAVPASFITDASGNVLLARWGVPTVSDVRKLGKMNLGEKGPTSAGR